MKNDQRNAFQERVARVENRKAAERPVSRKAHFFRKTDLGQALFYAFFSLGIITVLVVFGLKKLPGQNDIVSASTFGTHAPRTDAGLVTVDRHPPQDLSAHVVNGDDGHSVYSPAVVQTGGRILPLSAVAAERPTPGDTSLHLTAMESNGDCVLKPPSRLEKLVGVRVAGSNQPAPVTAYLYPDTNQIQAVDLSAIDVFLTDTTAPLYLVLQTERHAPLWTLHLAPGVRVSHVAVLAPAVSAVAGVPPGAGIEAVMAKDHDATACPAQPWRQPLPHWELMARADAGSALDQQVLARYAAGHTAFAAWYRGATGLDPAFNTVVASSVDHVLIGPLPQTPLSIASLAGKEIRVTGKARFMSGPLNVRRSMTTTLKTKAGGAVRTGSKPPEFRQ